MKIDELTRDDGALVGVFLEHDADGLALVTGEDVAPLPPGIMPKVMARYGAPFASETKVVEVATLDLGASERLRHVRHLDFGDVIAKDWLVYERPGAEPLCALAVTVAGALAHLARAAARADRG